MDYDHDATYSPEDNKIRIYPAYRLDREDYHRLKSTGFKWAAKQELFVAPMWTPAREDIAIEFCGKIGDEDTDLVTRAEMRAERFEGYGENRKADAHAAKSAVDSIADNIPLGQPILVGHHSEKRARRDAKRIENGMRKAVKMWETAKYWERRAAGAIRHARYKERPDVRARRIEKIEAELRKCLKNIKAAQDMKNLWLTPVILSKSRALAISNHISLFFQKFPLDKYPRTPPASQYEGDMSLWDALAGGIITPRQARNLHVPALERGIAYNKRWVAHCDNRLIYEKAMLEAQGASDLLEKKKRPKQLPICNYKAPQGIDIENIYRRGELSHYPQVEMTKADYKKINKDYKGTRTVENSHRVRIAMIKMKSVCVFLTDSKVHKKPAPIEKTLAPARLSMSTTPAPKQERTEFDDMKSALKDGVKTVSAPQLFPTPTDLAQQVIDAADIEPGMAILEPSAGTGNLIKPIVESVDTEILAYEINSDLCSIIESSFPSYRVQVRNKDFLGVTDFMGQYDRIVMNPPFKNGEDIKHIEHAIGFLRPGGRLVALCANGPRQRDKLKPVAEESGGYWEDLPAGSFKESGTNVNTAMLVIEG